jgi:DMSO/TMAO reductase YedYZ molybdopterin-dependent catalytic subunit
MNRRRFLVAAASLPLPAPAQRRLLMPSDEPDDMHFRLMWYNPVPPIDSSTYQLKVHGLVENPLTLSLSDLRKMPRETQNSRLKCVQCWSSRTTWSGFRFGHLIEAAKPRRTAQAVRFDCADKWYEYFPIQDLLASNVLMALEMAGKPLEARHGAPLRLIDPKRYGYKSAKLIVSVEFVAQGSGSMACDIGPYYSPGGEIRSGYDHPLDLGPNQRRKITGGEITDY